MATNQALLKSSRLFHLYSGVFLTPALLFFAFTGGIQTFSLHETTRGSSYKPPAILVELGQLHKKQTLVVPVRKGPPGETNPGRSAAPGAAPPPAVEGRSGEKHERRADHAADGEGQGARTPETKTSAAVANTAQLQTAPQTQVPASPAKVHNLLPMKIFFVIVSVGLFFSTLTGLYMSYKYARRKSTITLTLAAGIVVPLLLLLF